MNIHQPSSVQFSAVTRTRPKNEPYRRIVPDKSFITGKREKPYFVTGKHLKQLEKLESDARIARIALALTKNSTDIGFMKELPKSQQTTPQKRR